jgi:hypothetical protein
MPKINTKEDLKKYIALRLGGMFNTIEMEDEHYEIVIDDSIQTLQKYNYGEGNYFQYGVIELKPNQSQYHLRDIDNVITSTGKRVADIVNDPANLVPFVLPQDLKAWEDTEVDIEQIFELKTYNGFLGGINSMFTPMHSWWYGGGGNSLVGGQIGTSGNGGNGMNSIMGNGYNSYGAIVSNDSSVSTAPGATGASTGAMIAYDPLMPLSNYQWMMDYISSMEYYFKTMFQAHWRADAGILQVYPVPKKPMCAIIIYYKKEDAIYLYNNQLFKQLVVAEAKIQWSTNIGKYQADFAGGGSINYDNIKQEGKEEKEMIMEQIKGESTPPDFFVA